ncbi:deoxyguanosinetriphosphate triphosphohydrolase [Plebeiibacterium sediminum]|uniref:Deoxyguanosinetriphosphate triphosphohydrolase n=1 Tax=Plebeiibacterium sediminum TaxID=2992112 RepID=A0AAE3SFI1_9BACT|nr:deoxyguanosinetriphosphate triphosphohydrolase [Plebeiobacterium sediminum]MCW3787112.1 deoxyguanosinetriphosphate triphosphohydrolase [Plebeiobacterium sediminum]
MNWNQLLSVKRTGQEDRINDTKHHRTQFQRDYDRLIFSSPFRRLQDKTQVFPLPGSIFVHNRLTHSLEVASVGRSLGHNLTEFLISEKGLDNDLIHEIGSIVATACLAHDMGNPPFGHSGESALSHYFKEGEGKKLKDQYPFTEEEWNDLTEFEGNANAFRLLTHQFNGRRKGGFSLTYSSVASILKYPYASGQTTKKKYGYFQSEKEMFHRVVQELGLIEKEPGVYCRHPLVYLVEAADDICYQIMDVEDAHKLKILDTQQTKDILMSFLNDDEDKGTRDRIASVSEEVTDINEQIAFIRASVIGKLVAQCTQVFINNYDKIMNGAFEGSLTKYLEGNTNKAMKYCADLSFKKIYRHPSVVEIEISGFKILGSLLHEYSRAILNPNDKYSEMLLPFIPEQYKVSQEATAYEKLQSVLDYISGMTDIYALDLYRKINGIGLADKRF